MEALDQLNYALRLQKPSYTIIRNGNHLIVTEVPSPQLIDLFETVTPAQLDQRGDYEIVRCKFSLGDVNVLAVQRDLRLAISQEYQQFVRALPATNEFDASETGANLRKVRDTVEAIKKRKANGIFTYVLKHYDPEQFLIVSRPLLGIKDGAYARDDGSLIITVDPAKNRFILKGTPSAVEKFKNIAAILDVGADAEDFNTERPYLKSYPVSTDPEVAFKVVETMLDGTNARVGQDATSGAIVVRGRKEHHKLVRATIAILRDE